MLGLDFNKARKKYFELWVKQKLKSEAGIIWCQDFSYEKLLFLLVNITETCYIINIEEEDLDNDESIIPSCQEIIRENKSLDRNSSFAIWKSSDENHFFSIHYTHFIQEWRPTRSKFYHDNGHACGG